MKRSRIALLLIFVLGVFSFLAIAENFARAATIVDVQVQTNGDDAYAIPATSTFVSTGDVIQAGQQGGDDVYGGWRFKNIHVPSEAVITAAYVEFNQDGLDGGDTTTTLAFEDNGFPATFSTGNTPADRWSNRTSFETSFNFVEGQSGDWHQTPSLVDGLQELVDNYGALKDVVLLESGSGAANGHAWRSYDGDKSRATKLHIEYDDVGGSGGSVSCLQKAAHENFYFSGEGTFQIAPAGGNTEADLGACGAPRLQKNKKEKGAYDNIVVENLSPGRYRVRTLGVYDNGSTTQSDEIIRIVASDGDWIDIPDLNGSDAGPDSLWGEAEVDMCEANDGPTEVAATQNVIGELQEIVNSNPGTPLADKIEDALAKVQTALSELNKTPPDNEAAMGNIEGAVGDIEAAITDGLLDPTLGNSLMDQLMNVTANLTTMFSGDITIRGYNQVHPSTLSLDVTEISIDRIGDGSCPAPDDSPVAAISCSPGSCIGFTGGLILLNESTDPDGLSDIVQSTWNIDGIPITPCVGICNYTPSLATGPHSAIVTVQDSTGSTDTASSLSFTIEQDIAANFDCSLDGATWQNCSVMKGASEEVIYFRDLSIPSEDASTISTWAWAFAGGIPSSSAAQNPSVFFDSAGAKTVTLGVVDDGGRTASKEIVLDLTLPFPDWKEVPPF